MRQGAEASNGPATLLAWRVHPARERPLAAVGVAVFVALAATALQLGLRTPWMTAAGAAVLVGAVAEFLFPTSYRLTAAGAERRGLCGYRWLPWEAVKAAYLFPGGVKLSGLERAGLAEAWSGLFLPWGGQREEILRLVARHAEGRRRAGEETRGDEPAEA